MTERGPSARTTVAFGFACRLSHQAGSPSDPSRSSKITFGDPKTKNFKRTVPLTRSIVAEIEQHLAEYVPETGPDALAITSAAGNPLYLGTFWPSILKPAVKKAGLDGLRITTSGTPTCR